MSTGTQEMRGPVQVAPAVPGELSPHNNSVQVKAVLFVFIQLRQTPGTNLYCRGPGPDII